MKKTTMMLMAGALAAGVSATGRAAVVFTENFETPPWTAGTQVSSPVNGWIMRAPGSYSINNVGGAQGQVLASTVSAGGNINQTAGKLHGVDLTGEVVDLSGQVALSGAFTALAQLWLSDSNQNGYGIYFNRNNYNQASIIKFENSTIAFGGQAQWAVQQGEHSGTTVTVGGQNDGFIDYHLRLQQSAPGAAMTLTLWFTNSNVPDTSFASPAMQLVDDGTGSVFFNNGTNAITGQPCPTFTAPFNLASLQYVALTDQPTPGGLAQFDNITVVVPEPATLGLLAAAGLVAAGLRRRTLR